jgi:predicted small lipoprotein YifL
MKKMYRKMFVLVLVFAFLAACSPTGILPNPGTENNNDANAPTSSEDPQAPGKVPHVNENLQPGNVFIDETQLLIMESFPPQFNLVIRGNLPTPCHQLHVVQNDPDAQNRINIEVISLVDPDQICIQVLQPFEEVVSLGSFADGAYTVLINGEKVSEFTSP